MNKSEFVALLRKGLTGLPLSEIEERAIFYSEMIDDRMEEGMSEADAVSQVGNIDDIVAQIKSESVQSKPSKNIKSKKGLDAWSIVLIVLGAPVWISLLIAALSVILSAYVVLWSVIVSLWAVFGSLVGCAFGGIVIGIGNIYKGNYIVGAALIGAGIVCTGLSIFWFYACKAATNGILWLTKKIALGIKNCFVKKEETL